MGITSFEVELLKKYVQDSHTNVVELGSQNLYLNGEENPPFANEFYEELGLRYDCIDLAGDNGAFQGNLAFPMQPPWQFSIVTNFGTSEHIVQSSEYETTSFHNGHINSVYPKGEVKIEEGFRNCWVNIFNLCKIGGLIFCVNPKTGNWPGHGYVYLTQDFYNELARVSDLEILELGENAAMGNTTDGWNIYCVLQKTGYIFPNPEKFSQLPIFRT